MAQIELVEILARNDINLRIPLAIEVVEGCKPLLLLLAQIGKVFQNKFHSIKVFRLDESTRTCVHERGESGF